VAEGEGRGGEVGGGSPRSDEPTLHLPDWRDPPTGEIPRIIEELAGEPLPSWRVEDAGRFDVVLDGAGPPKSGDDAGEPTVEIRPEGTPRPTDEQLEETWHRDPDTLSRETAIQGDGTLADPPTPRHLKRRSLEEAVAAQGAPAPTEQVGEGAARAEPGVPGHGGQAWEEGPDWPEALLAAGGARRSDGDATRLGGAEPPRGSAHPTRHDVVASRRRKRAEAEPDDPAPAPPMGRSKLVSTLTGIVLGALVLAALARGPVTTLVVVVVALGVAVVEAYALLRRAGHVPMIALGVASVVAMPVLGYVAGEGALLATLVGSTIVTLLWFVLLRGGRYLLRGFGPTQAMVLWVGLFGSFASLMLRPADFGPDGLGLLVGTLATAVAADVFAFFGGSLVGRHPLAPRISPGKTVEGVVIGGIAAVLVGALGVARIHPFDPVSGLALGVLAAVIVPLGDLAESALKRLVDAKDSSRLLPGHGGMLDRIDGILLLLPCAYALFSLMRLA